MSGIRRIFYDKSTGAIIQEIGRNGDFILPSIEQDIDTYTSLSERNRETFDVLEIPFEFYEQDFEGCTGYRVNVQTRDLEFNYPDPNDSAKEPVYVKPLSEQVKQLEKDNTLLKAQNKALADKTDFHEEVLTEIILAINS